ncbi:MAG: hypothetical protein HY961_18775 [Ignavibacteriae bacterium]|nr:hypothetical protein [Ignavibacteriota bacterium]
MKAQILKSHGNKKDETMGNSLAIFEGYKIRRRYDEKNRDMVFFGGGYNPSVVATAGLSSGKKLLESAEESLD